jgi:hypothetical protein
MITRIRQAANPISQVVEEHVTWETTPTAQKVGRMHNIHTVKFLPFYRHSGYKESSKRSFNWPGGAGCGKPQEAALTG